VKNGPHFSCQHPASVLSPMSRWVGHGHLVGRHVPGSVLGLLLIAGVVFAVIAFWTASLTPLSFLAATIVVVWAIAVFRDLLVVPRKPIAH
jgi:membrane protein YdbS with pleckstrin-like domain